MIAFYLLATPMIVGALAFLVVPLLRASAGGRAVDPRLRALDDALASGVIDEAEHAAKRAAFTTAGAASAPRSRAGFAALVASVLLLPGSAILAYSQLGTPAALDPKAHVAADGSNIDMDQAVAGLATKLQQNPNDGQGWALLGRAYMSLRRPGDAVDAFRRANQLLPDNADLMADFAQALVMGANQPFAGEPKQLIDRALTLQPDNQRALWLRGVAEYQADEFDTAIATWTRLQTLLPAGSPVATSVQAQIDDARARLGGNPSAGAASSAADATAAEASTATASADASKRVDGPRLTIAVRLDPKFAADVDGQYTLFVFARAAAGPPMPLAIQRLTAAQLPLTVTLDESNGMLPELMLSMFPQVVIGARISRSGDPKASSGDWQVLSAPVDVQRREPIDLVIDQVVP